MTDSYCFDSSSLCSFNGLGHISFFFDISETYSIELQFSKSWIIFASDSISEYEKSSLWAKIAKVLAGH